MKKPIKINVHLNHVQIVSRHYFKRISDSLSFKVPGYQYSNAYINKFWDGRHRFLDTAGRFPLGLLWRFIDFCKVNNVKVLIKYSYKINRNRKVVRVRERKEGFDTLSTKLRDYEIEAARIAFHKRRGLIKIPTGGGKTLVMVALLNFIGRPSLILTSKKESLVDFSEILKYELLSDSVGVMGGGICDPKIHDIGSFQFLYRHRYDLQEYLNTKTVVLIDEAHHSSSKSHSVVINNCRFARWKVGFTATPSNSPTAMITESCIGPVVYNCSSRDLIKKKYLTEPEITMVKVDKVEHTGTEKLHVRLDYHTAYNRGISNNDYRNDIIGELCEKLIKKKKYPAILAKTIEHVNRISAVLKIKKIDHVILTGTSSVADRLSALEGMRAEVPLVIIFSTIFDEALDVPALKSIIMAGSGRSFRQTVQRMGRGMRIHKGKKKVNIYDFYDTTHGYLERHSKVRERIYKKEGYVVLVKTIEEI